MINKITELPTVPIFQFHCLTPERVIRRTNKVSLSPHEVKLIAEHVCDKLCKVDEEFAVKYFDQLFGVSKHNPWSVRSGVVKIYSREFLAYFCAPKESWIPIMSIKKLQFYKEIQSIVNE